MTADSRQSSLPAVHEAWLPREHSLYRPRHSRRQALALVCAAVFFATPLLSFVLGVRPGEFENRPLTPFPALSQGWGFFAQLSPWATDHLPYREEAIHAADGLSRGLFGEPPPLGGRDQTQGPIQQQQQQQQEEDSGPGSFPPMVEGKDGWLYLGAEVESHCRQQRSLDETVSALRRLRDGVEDSGRRFVVVIAPDKATVVPEYLPDDYVGRDCHRQRVDEFWRRMASEDYVLDLRGDLRAWGERSGAPVYGPLDAHWSDEGGVTMARAVAEKLRPGITATWAVTPAAAWQVPADLPPLIGREGTTDGRHYSIKPDGGRDQARDVPGNFFTEPARLRSATGPGTYGSSVAMFSDSFTYRAMRYLAAGFGDMTVLHHGMTRDDEGRAAADMLAGHSAVVIEVAERTLVSGEFGVLGSPTLDTILGKLAERPIR